MSFKIITDTSCNLPLKILNENDISVIPFCYFSKDKGQPILNCLDIENFNGKAYYDDIRNNKLYNTSQINPETFMLHMTPCLQNDNNDILFISMSSGISGSFNSSLIAKKMLEEKFPNKKIYCLDTKAASLGEGLVVLEAIKLKNAGYKIEDCYNQLESFCKSIYQVFVVDDLKHLQRTGRISNAARIVGSVLGIKPILKGNEKGQIVVKEIIRGQKNAINSLFKKYKTLVKNAKDQIIGISHADNPTNATKLAQMINEYNKPKDIITVCFEPIAGAHVGAGTVALFFLGDCDVRMH